MDSVRVLGFVLLLASAAAACRPAEPSARAEVAGDDDTLRYGQLELEACQLGAEGLAVRIPAECGSIAVPENPDDPGGHEIELALAVRRAVVRAKAPEPVFFMAGGPGQSARESYVALASAFGPLRRRHDIVLVDQRGTGASGALECAGGETGADDPVVRLDLLPATLTEQASACAAELEADGIDPRQYTTSRAIDDLDAVRAALGVERINLVGLSYGTRVAQAYAARYPERARSLVLDGIVPLDRPLGGTAAADAQAALGAHLARCAADEGCNVAFGPPDSWSPDALQARLAESPVTIEVRDPSDARPRRVDVTADVVAVTVRLLLYATETTSLLPLTLSTAAGGDFAPLAAQFLLVAGELDAGIDQGMNHSVTCAEDAPRLEEPGAWAAMRESESRTFVGTTLSSSLAAACAEWPRGDAPADIVSPLLSDVPALLVSGQWDPVTPAAGAEHALAGLTAGRHLVAPGQGHGVMGRGCMPDLVAEFVEAGSADHIDAGCLDALVAAPFFTSFAGPRP